MEEIIAQFNKFFYRTQQERMLGLGYIFLTKEGFLWTVFVFIVSRFYMSMIFLMVIVAGYGYIYLKLYNLKITDRETVWLINLWRKWLGREDRGAK